MNYGNESHGNFPATPSTTPTTSVASATSPNQGGWAINEGEGMPGMQEAMPATMNMGADDGDYCNVAAQDAFSASHGRPAGSAMPDGLTFVPPGNPTAAEGAGTPEDYGSVSIGTGIPGTPFENR